MRSPSTSRRTSASAAGGQWPRPTRPRRASSQGTRGKRPGVAREPAWPRAGSGQGPQRGLRRNHGRGVRAGRAAILRDGDPPDARPRLYQGRLPADARAARLPRGPRLHGLHLLGRRTRLHPPGLGADIRHSPRASDRLCDDTRVPRHDIYRTKDAEQPIDDGTGKPEHIWMRTAASRCSWPAMRTATCRCSRPPASPS